MEEQDYEPDWRKRLENMFSATGKEKIGEPEKEEYGFKKKEGEDIYSYTVAVSKVKEPKDKIDELTILVQDVGNLSPFKRMKSPKRIERINELVAELAKEYHYRRERKVGQDHYVYTRRIGEECDVLINACGKTAYAHMNLRRPGKHHFYPNIYKVLVQKKEIKKIGRAFWSVEEGCFMGTYAQRLLSYIGFTGFTTFVSTAFGFYKGGLFLTLNMPIYATAGLFSALIAVGAVHLRHVRKQKKIFREYAQNLVYNKEAIEKAFSYNPHKGMVQENPH